MKTKLKKNNKKRKNNKLILIIAISIIGLIIVSVVILINLKDETRDIINNSENNGINNNTNNNVVKQESKVTGKLAEYISSLTQNYLVKYHGKFKNVDGKLADAIVEYTKDGKDFALSASDLGIDLICENDRLYSISHKYKIIVGMNRENIDISEYNLVSDFGQIYVKTYKEMLNGKMCDVDEYKYKSNNIKYYFQNNNIKLIKYNNQEISVIRVEKQTNEQLFEMPKGYSTY